MFAISYSSQSIFAVFNMPRVIQKIFAVVGPIETQQIQNHSFIDNVQRVCNKVLLLLLLLLLLLIPGK